SAGSSAVSSVSSVGSSASSAASSDSSADSLALPAASNSASAAVPDRASDPRNVVDHAARGAPGPSPLNLSVPYLRSPTEGKVSELSDLCLTARAERTRIAFWEEQARKEIHAT